MKKKILVLLIAVMFFALVGDVKALKMYNDFKPGDKVNVYLNENETGEFTVIENDTDTITAIYNTYYGDENSLYNYDEAKKIIDEIKKDWIIVDKVSFISPSDIVDNFNNIDTEFTSPAWAVTDFPYWTSTQSFYVENSVIKKGTTTDKAYVRPVIRIAKTYVKEGVNRPKTWDEFVEYYINYVESSVKINYTYDANGLTASMIDPENNEEYFAKYEFDGNSLTLIEDNNSEMVVDLLSYLYEILPFESKVEVDQSVTDNGINHENLKFVYDLENYKTTEFKVDLNYFLDFNSNSNNQVSDVVNNPKTSDVNVLLVGMSILLVGAITIVGIKKLKKIK